MGSNFDYFSTTDENSLNARLNLVQYIMQYIHFKYSLQWNKIFVVFNSEIKSNAQFPKPAGLKQAISFLARKV